MSRSSKFLTGLGASYISVGVNIVYSLASVPIGLHYLGADAFGLWMVLTQLASYLSLLEIGVHNAFARILIDHKDGKQSCPYREVIASGSVLLIAQGLLILLVAWLVGPFLKAIFNIPAELGTVAVNVFGVLGIATGLSTALKIFSALLYANQRIDLVALLSSTSLIINLAIIWPLLAFGYGLWSVALGAIAAALTTGAVSFILCRRLHFLPMSLGFADVRLSRLREMLAFGRDIFMVHVGSLLLDASQLIVVSKTMGLAAAATWSVSTKLFTVIFQLVVKVEGTAIVFFSEMMVRGHKDLLFKSFRQIYQLTAILAVCGLFGAAAVNQFFVVAWAGANVLWDNVSSWLMAFLMLTNLLLRCFIDLALHTKIVGRLRFVYFFEGIAFLALAYWAASRYGFVGVLLAGLICAVVLRGPYAVIRTARFFSMSPLSLLLKWNAFLVGPMLLMALTALLIAYIAPVVQIAWWRATLAAGLASTAAVFCILTIGLPPELRGLVGKFFRGWTTVITERFRCLF